MIWANDVSIAILNVSSLDSLAKVTADVIRQQAAHHTALGAPPPSMSVNFEDAEELQEILAEVTARPAVQDAGASLEAVVTANGHPSQVAWEQQVDAHLANTERLSRT